MSFLVRSRSLLYGDGYAAVASTLHSWTQLFQSVHEWLKPLSVGIYKLNYELLHRLTGSDATSSFAICSSIGGAVGLVGTLHLIGAVAKSPHERLFLFLALFTSGSILLFFGHLEFYVWSIASLVWLLALAHDTSGKQSSVGLTALSIVTILLNVMLLPAVGAIFLLAHKQSAPPRLQRLIAPRTIFLAGVAASAILAFLLQWFNLSYGTVPLVPYESSHYWLLSLDHISDLLNALVFSCPLIFSLVWPTYFRSTARSHGLLVVSAALLWLVSVWIDPDAGAARDWDLLSLYGIPLTLFCALSLSNTVRSPGSPRFVLPLIALCLFTTVPYLYEKVDRDRLVNRLDSVIFQDPHYRSDYMDGSRTISWGALLYNEEKRPDLAAPYFHRRIQADSTGALAFGHLGTIFMEMRSFDSAEVYLKQAYRRDSMNDVLRVQLSNAPLFQEKWGDLATLLLHAPTADSQYVSVLHQCARGLFINGELNSALLCYHQLDSLRTGSIYYKLALALSYARTGQNQTSLQFFSAADSICVDSMRFQLYSVALKDLISYDCLSVASKLVPMYRQACPDEDRAIIKAVLGAHSP